MAGSKHVWLGLVCMVHHIQLDPQEVRHTHVVAPLCKNPSAEP